jgi:hypothetical protein
MFLYPLLPCICDQYPRLNPTGDYMYAYSIGTDSQGKPHFTTAGESANTFTGSSVPTVTSMNGQPGTGIVNLAPPNSNNMGLTMLDLACRCQSRTNCFPCRPCERCSSTNYSSAFCWRYNQTPACCFWKWPSICRSSRQYCHCW